MTSHRFDIACLLMSYGMIIEIAHIVPRVPETITEVTRLASLFFALVF